MVEVVRNILAVAVILSTCSILIPASGKGFDANGEKDNGKRKYIERAHSLAYFH